jgi:hypothetical protein
MVIVNLLTCILQNVNIECVLYNHKRHLEIVIIKLHVHKTYCAEPHAGCCGGWGLKTSGYPISCARCSYGVNTPLPSLSQIKPRSEALSSIMSK